MTRNSRLAQAWADGLKAGLDAGLEATEAALGIRPEYPPVPTNPYDRPDHFEPLIGDRIGPAWLAAARVLRSGAWHNRIAIVDTMLFEITIAKNTATNVLRNAVNAGWLEQRGTHPNIEIRATEAGRDEREELR